MFGKSANFFVMAFSIPTERHEEIGQRIGLIALDYGGQRRLAVAIGSNDSSLSQVINGAVGAGNKILIPLADLGYNVQWILTGIGNMRLAPVDLPPRPLTNDELLEMVRERMRPENQT